MLIVNRILTRTGVYGNFDLSDLLHRLFIHIRLIVRIHQNLIEQLERIILTLLGKHVIDALIHLEIRILHCFCPDFLLFTFQLRRLAAHHVVYCILTDMQEMCADHTAHVEFPKESHAERGIKGKDCLEVGRISGSSD